MASKIPQTFAKLRVCKLTQHFREAVEKVKIARPTLQPGNILVKNRYVGINASDINFSSGRYQNQSTDLPMDCGFEGVGEVVDAASDCQDKIGQAVIYMQNGAFSEYIELPAKSAVPIPAARKEYLPLMVSGLTAAISLDKVGEMKSGETVLVTAAAGGTGQFAVQLAKLRGCHVIGTCSTDEKIQFLKDLGCDRPINYRVEKLDQVLKTEYPAGVDVVYESVGGEVYDTCVKRLAVKGRLIVIGFISGYENNRGFVPSKLVTLPQHLLPKQASVRSFLLFLNTDEYKPYMKKLVELLNSGQIQSKVDLGEQAPTGPFLGVDSIVNAVEYLYSGKNKGKIVVEFPDEPMAKL